jgi:hypothetical protein
MSSSNNLNALFDDLDKSREASHQRNMSSGYSSSHSGLELPLIVGLNNARKKTEEYILLLAKAYAIRESFQENIKKIVGNDSLPLIDDKNLRDRIGNAAIAAFDVERDFNHAKEAGATFKLSPDEDLSRFLISRKKFVEVVDLAQARTIVANERTEMLNKANEKNAEQAAQIESLKAHIEDLDKALEKSRSLASVGMNSIPAKSAESSGSGGNIAVLEELNRSLSKYSEELKREVDSLTKSCAQHMAQSSAFRAQLNDVDPTNPLITDSLLRQRVAEVAYSQLAATNFKDWDVVKQVGSSFVSPRERQKES